MRRHGWVLLFHECIVEQLQKLYLATERALRSDPEGFATNANVKLFRVLSQLILETVPGDPGRDEYRQGNTLGLAYRHWRRAKVGRRFRLFFRYDSRSMTIVFAWVNDEKTLRSSGGKSDPLVAFGKMLEGGILRTTWRASSPQGVPVGGSSKQREKRILIREVLSERPCPSTLIRLQRGNPVNCTAPHIHSWRWCR